MSRIDLSQQARFTIDGREFAGSSVSIREGRLTVDEVPIEGQLVGVVEVRVFGGALGSLVTDASCMVDACERVEAGESVTVCRDVFGPITAGGSVTVGGNVAGSVVAGGPVLVGSVLPGDGEHGEG